MTGIPPELMYSLDCGVEGGDLTADIHAFLTVLDPGLCEWYSDLAGPDFFSRFRAESRQRYAAWRGEASPQERATLTWIGFNELPSLITDSARHVLSSTIKEIGPNKDDVKALLSSSTFITEFAKPFLPSLHEIVMRCRDDIRIMGAPSFLDSREHTNDMYKRITTRRNEPYDENLQVENTRRRILQEPRSVRKAKRKPLIKATDLLAKIAGRQTASSFIGGDDIIVTGRQFNFRVRKGVLTSNGHGAMNLTVTDKDNIELVDLCFYFEDMPAPDQLAALILHVQAGNEDDILRTANTIRTHDAGHENAPLLKLRQEKKKLNALAYADAEDNGVGGAMGSHIDRVLYNGIRGSNEFYRRHYDEFIPRLEQAIVEIAMESRAGAFMQTHVPEALRLIEIAKPPQSHIGRARAEEPLMFIHAL